VVTQLNQRAAAARVPSAGDTANRDELKDDLEKWKHHEELAELFFAAKTAPPSGTTAPSAENITEAIDLTRRIRTCFASDLYRNLGAHRSQIRGFANKRNSWTSVGRDFWRGALSMVLGNIKWPEPKICLQ
jgi:hypothetical protein